MDSKTIRTAGGFIVLALLTGVTNAGSATNPSGEAEGGSVGNPPDSLHVEFPALNLVEFTLSNGIRCAVIPDSAAQLVSVETLVQSAPLFEPDGKEGIAHFLEHLAFTSSRGYPDGGVERGLELYAAYHNAGTSGSRIAYVTSCIPAYLDSILRLDADRLAHPDPTAREFAREQQVVRQEIAFRKQYDPWTDILIASAEEAYAGHPYGRSIAGTDSSVAAITLEDYLQYHRHTVAPRRTAILLTGPVDPKDVEVRLESAFGGWPGDSLSDVQEVPPFPEAHDASIEMDRSDITGYIVALGTRLSTRTYQEKILSYFLATAMSRPGLRVGVIPYEGESFLTMRRFLVYPKAFVAMGVTISEPPPPEVSASRSWEYSLRLWEQRRMHVLSPFNFPKVKQQVEARFSQGLKANPTLLDAVKMDLLYRRSLAWVGEIQSFLDTLQVQTVRTYYKDNVNNNRLIRAVVHGSDSGRSHGMHLAGLWADSTGGSGTVPLAELTREDIEPVIEACRRARRPEITLQRLKSGAPCYSVRIEPPTGLFIGGYREVACFKEEKKHPGISRVYSSLVDYEWESDEEEHLEKRDLRTYQVHLDASPDLFSFSLVCPSAEAEKKGMEHLRERLETNEFSVSRWRFEREYPVTVLGPESALPLGRAEARRMGILLGNQAMLTGLGQPEEVEDLKYKDLQKLHEKLTTTGRLSVYAVSSMPEGQLLAAVEGSLGDRSESRPCKEPRSWETAIGQVTGFIETDFDQSECTITASFPPFRADQGWAVLAVATEHVQSLLTDRIRRASGLTYWVSADLRRLGDMLFLEVSFESNPRTSRQAIALFQAGLEELALDLDANDLARAQLSVMDRLWTDMQTPEDAWTLLGRMMALGAPPADPSSAIADVSLEATTGILRMAVNPRCYAFSVTGPILEETLGDFLAAVGQ